MRHLLVSMLSGLFLLVFAAPASADLPVKGGEFWNGSKTNGVSFDTTRRAVRNLQFFCNRQRWDLEKGVFVKRDGSFRFRGRARHYGESAEPLGIVRIKLKGRFTSSERVRIKRTIPGCGTKTVRAGAG